MTWHFPPLEPLVIPKTLDGMTQETWMRLSSADKDRLRDLSHLSPQLIGMEGWRVEVVDAEISGGQTRRFIVGKSTGWRPCHLEIHNRRSRGGHPACKRYQSVRRLEKVR